MSGRLGLTLAVVLLGCGAEAPPISVSSRAEAPAPSPPEPTPAPEAPPTPAAPSPSPSTPEVRTAPGGQTGAPTSGPAFVIHAWRARGTSAERLTVIVPLDPATPARSIPGVVVLDDAASPPTLRWVIDASDHPMPCPCACAGACTMPEHAGVLEIDPSTLALVPPACGCFRAEDAAQCGEDGRAVAATVGEREGDAEGAEEDCSASHGRPASLVGGRLFVPFVTHDECDGADTYAGGLQTLEVTASAWRARGLPARGTSCNPEASTGEWAFVGGEMPLLCDRRRGGWRGDDMDCSPCDARPDGVLARLSQGRLELNGSHVDSSGSGAGWLAYTEASPSDCPSAADPCGPLGRFAVIERLSPAAGYWAATDGSALLVLTDELARGGTVQLLLPDAGEPAREVPLPIQPDDVLGVRFHRYAALLASVADRGLPVVSTGGTCPATAR